MTDIWHILTDNFGKKQRNHTKIYLNVENILCKNNSLIYRVRDDIYTEDKNITVSWLNIR